MIGPGCGNHYALHRLMYPVPTSDGRIPENWTYWRGGSTLNQTDGFLYVDVGRNNSLMEVERHLSNLDQTTGQEYILRLATKTSNEIFADIWAAILTGTVCCHASGNVEILTWGYQSLKSDIRRTNFAFTLHGLVALQLAESVVTDTHRVPVDGDAVEELVSITQKGILETKGGSTRTLVEFDPQQATALALQDSSISKNLDRQTTRRRLFHQLLLNFRKALEVGNLRRNINPIGVGAIGSLATFISELHDNAYEHGRLTPGDSSRNRNIRFFRLKKHIANTSEQMIDKSLNFNKLSNYMKHMSKGHGQQVFIEASVSDFGLGIVDHFLISKNGRFYASHKRNELLHSLLHENLSAKSGDPAAGYGIQHALRAAKKLSGFVSLRTGEFWLAQSYADPSSPTKLVAVDKEHHPAVAGTHWQFIWPNPI